MTTRWTTLGALALAGLAAAAPAAAGPPPYPRDLAECKTGDDVPNPAVNCPSERAWQIFAEINRPSDEAPGRTRWQTWALDQDVFPPCPDPAKCSGDPHADDPLHCPTLPKPDRIPEASPPSKVSAHFRTVLRSRGLLPDDPAEIAQDVLLAETELVYRNDAEVDYIVRSRLWYQEGQIEAFARAERLGFPHRAIAVKAHWLPIEESDKTRYHWGYLLTDDGKSRQLVGLVGLVFMAKEIPNWFWAAFEHVDNLGACDFIGCFDDYGAQPAFTPSKTPYFELYRPPRMTAELETLLSRAGLGSVWRNYRLKGVQIDFTDGEGRPTLLGDSQIEAGFLATSSCITCHSRSTVAPTAPVSGPGTQVPHNVGIFDPVINGQSYSGAPDPAWFRGPSGAQAFLQLDFTWGFSQAAAADPAIRALSPGQYTQCTGSGGS